MRSPADDRRYDHDPGHSDTERGNGKHDDINLADLHRDDA